MRVTADQTARRDPRHRRAGRISGRRKRGATFLYAIAIIASVSLLVGVNLDLTTSVRKMQARSEQALLEDQIRSAAISVFRERALRSPSAALNSTDFDLAGVNYDMSVAKATTPGAVTLTVSKGAALSLSAEAVDPRGVQPQLYGLATKDFDMDKKLVLGDETTPTNAFFGKKPAKAPVSGSRIYGSVDSVDSDIRYSATGVVTTGFTWTDPVKCARLVWVPSETSLGSPTISGRTTSNLLTFGYNYLITAGGTPTVTGTFSGRITIYGNAGVTLKPPIIVTPGSVLVVMSDNDIKVEGQGRIDCHLYTSGKLDIPASPGTIDWTGSIVVKQMTCKTAVNLKLDPYFYSDPDAIENCYLPSN